MTALELVWKLLHAVCKHGNQQVVVAGDDSDIYLAGGVRADDNDGGTAGKFFWVEGGEYFDRGRPRPAPTPEQARIVAAISKALTANSPFLGLLEGGTFPKDAGNERR